MKEFVHGDFGRTVPSLGTLLDTSADILELDVEVMLLIHNIYLANFLFFLCVCVCSYVKCFNILLPGEEASGKVIF